MTATQTVSLDVGFTILLAASPQVELRNQHLTIIANNIIPAYVVDHTNSMHLLSDCVS